MRIALTSDHKYRIRALAVPDAFWDGPEKEYAIIDPSPRAARAAIALFPDVLNRHPELLEVSNAGLESVRPTDYATALGLPMDVDLEGIELYPWQESDLAYIKAILQRDGAAQILWSRGLGKTIAAAAFMRKLEAQRTLIVCRNDAKDPVWREQLEAILPEHHLMVLPNPKPKRERMLEYVAHYDGAPPLAFLVHYESLALIAGNGGKGNGWDKLPWWDLMVFDEGHRLARMNPNSPQKNTQMGYGTMKARRRSRKAINLTGSAIMNHAEDLFGQLHYLYPDRYKAKWRDYNDRFLDFVDVGGQNVCIGFKEERLPALRDELGVFSVYRTKEDVLDLPRPDMQTIKLDLLPKQREAYEQMRDQFWAEYDGGTLIAANVLAQLNLLRQLATWREGLPSAKLDFAVSQIEEALPDEQFVVFTWYKPPGRAILERLGDQAVVVDGDVTSKDRARALAQHKRGDARVLVGSIATIGESLNLQYCSEAIRLDRHWNPGVNDQTHDRLIRDGQKNIVCFRDLVARDTIDELRVQPRLDSKISLRKAVFGS